MSTQFDWTAQSGCSNSSPEFKRLVRRVSEMIRNNANNSNADGVARLIMAQLAHEEHLMPIVSIKKDSDGNYSGRLFVDGRVVGFKTQPLG